MTTELDNRHATLVAQLSDDERADFETYYQFRLSLAIQAANQEASGTALGAADPDEVEALLVERLIREAEGRDNPDGMGTVPHQSEVYELLPPESDPRLQPARPGTRGRARGASSQEMTPARWAGIAAVLAGLILWLAFSLFGGNDEAIAHSSEVTPTLAEQTAQPSPEVTPTALVDYTGGNDITVAYPASLEINGQTIYRVLASASQLGGTWQPELPPGAAAWLNGTYINAVFCLPANAAPMLETLGRGDSILMRPASGAVRRYEVLRRRTVGRQQVEVMDQRRAGMTLLLCGQQGNERAVVEAVYRPEERGEKVANQGASLDIPGVAHVQLGAVTILTDTTALPPGMVVAELTAEIRTLLDGALRWTDLADQLEINGAAAENRSVLSPVEGAKKTRVQFRYLVPSSGGAATWRLTAATGETVSFSVAIPPAPAQLSQPSLRASLSPADIQVLEEPAGTSNRTFYMTVHAQATSSEVIDLQPSDVSVWLGSKTLPLGSGTSPLPLRIQPGETKALRLVVAVPDVTAIEVRIKSQRWRVTLP